MTRIDVREYSDAYIYSGEFDADAYRDLTYAVDYGSSVSLEKEAATYWSVRERARIDIARNCLRSGTLYVYRGCIEGQEWRVPVIVMPGVSAARVFSLPFAENAQHRQYLLAIICTSLCTQGMGNIQYLFAPLQEEPQRGSHTRQQEVSPSK